ncbi:hypothetical protein [Paracoccus ravus]|nr:hypothetical protein [Paracoccus ravus]
MPIAIIAQVRAATPADCRDGKAKAPQGAAPSLHPVNGVPT